MKYHVLVAKDQEKMRVLTYHPKKLLKKTSALPEVDVNIGRCNLNMKLPTKIQLISNYLQRKNKSKLDNTNESKTKTNTKLDIINKTINVQDKDNIPKTFTLTKQNNNETKTIKNKEKYSE